MRRVPERIGDGRFRITGAGDDTWQGVDEYSTLYAPAGGDEDWEAVVRILGDPARYHGRGRGVSYLLTGMIYCGVCGGRMYARPGYHSPDSPDRPENRYYQCMNNVVPRMARMGTDPEGQF